MPANALDGPLDGAGAPERATSAVPWLNRLRLAALRCRAAARLDPCRACEGLDEAGPEACAETLIRAFAAGNGRTPRLLRPGCSGTTFDERWLVALILAAGRDDADSMRFLLVSRVGPAGRAPLARLAARVARRLDEPARTADAAPERDDTTRFTETRRSLP